MTAEIKKNRYTYYHCTHYRGKCSLPNFREEELADRLGLILKNIHIPDGVLADLSRALQNSAQYSAQELAERLTRLEQQLGAIRRRQNQAYVDKLDGAISPEFWESKSKE